MNEVEIQRQYYDRTAAQYDEMHLTAVGGREHLLAIVLKWCVSLISGIVC